MNLNRDIVTADETKVPLSRILLSRRYRDQPDAKRFLSLFPFAYGQTAEEILAAPTVPDYSDFDMLD